MKRRSQMRRYAPLLTAAWVTLAIVAVLPQSQSHALTDVTPHATIAWDHGAGHGMLAPGSSVSQVLTVTNTTARDWSTLAVRVRSGGVALQQRVLECTKDWADSREGTVCRGLVTAVSSWTPVGNAVAIASQRLERGSVSHLQIELRVSPQARSFEQGRPIPLDYEIVTA